MSKRLVSGIVSLQSRISRLSALYRKRVSNTNTVGVFLCVTMIEKTVVDSFPTFAEFYVSCVTKRKLRVSADISRNFAILLKGRFDKAS